MPDNQTSKKRASGVPTGNAGEYFVMGELLRRGWDAQLADRNTKGYDILIGYPEEPMLRKVQVKTVRQPPWYVNLSNFEDEFLERSTIYVLLGKADSEAPVRYFIAKNSDIVGTIHRPSGWDANGFVNLKSVKAFEGQWQAVHGLAGRVQP
jgi:hypothetical protein